MPLDQANSFIEFETAMPEASGHDILVKVSANSINPVDYMIRESAAAGTVLEEPRIIGWDAVGTVEAVGEKVSLFKVGDRVFYAGNLNRSGCNAEYQLVDQRIAAHAPTRSSDAEAAAMPLTSLTAYEALYDRIRIDPLVDKGKSILIIAGAGGVGSVAIQLAKHAGLVVIATASREDSSAWCKKMGADFVVNHHKLEEELSAIDHSQVNYILDLVSLGDYWKQMTEIIKPQGHIVSITQSTSPLILDLLKIKSVSFSWEFMFTRSMFETADMIRQHEILETIATMMDQDTLQSTLTTTLDGLTAENFKRAHQMQKTAQTIGKTVIIF